jgi:hypothetical protein
MFVYVAGEAFGTGEMTWEKRSLAAGGRPRCIRFRFAFSQQKGMLSWSCRGGPTYARSRRDLAIPIAPGRITEIDENPALNTRPRNARKCKSSTV